MRSIRRLWARTVNFITRSTSDRRLREEMEEHLALQIEENIHAGMSAAEARRQAILKFGPAEAVRESYHAEEGLPLIESALQDCRYALRMLLRSPVLSVVAVLTLALGIGANTAIFSFLDAVMLRSLPVRDPQRLVKLGVEDWDGITDSFASTELYSYPFYRQFQRDNRVFSDTAAVMSMMNEVHGFVDDGKQLERINVQTVSGTYFQTLGVGPQIGRVINESDDSTEGAHPVLVISYGFWKHRLGGDPAVLDHKLKLGNTVFNIVGVAPPEFFGTKVGEAPDAWAPLSMMGSIPPGWNGRKDNFSESLYILGRLKPGVTPEEATANVNVLFPQILRSFPDAKLTQENSERLARTRVPLKSLARGISDLRNAYSEPLKVLMVIVALVLLIACANIANLLLARSTSRARELAVRQALGAARIRIIRQLLTESLVLALAGGALGIAFAAFANRLLLHMISSGPETIPLDVSLNLRLLAFTFAVTVGTALLFGTLPAVRATRIELSNSLKIGRGTFTAGARTPLARALVISQVALSLLLTVGAFLFLRTLNNLSRVNPGFNRENVLRLDIDSSVTGYTDDDPRLKAIFHEIEERVSSLPGVEAASFSAFTFAEGSWNTTIIVPGKPFDRRVNVKHNSIGNDYFKVMQIPLVAGRQFGPQDTATSQPVAIISEAMARNLFPAGSPIGRTYSLGSPDGMEAPAEKQVIGVVKDVKFNNVAESQEYIDYLPYAQRGWGFGDFEVRYTGSFSAAASKVQQAIHAIDRTLPITNVTTLDKQVARSYSNQAIIAQLSAFFGIVAVFLSSIGLYGIMSYLVSRKTGEIGIRMALGAERADVGWQVMREVVLWIAAGIIIALPLTIGSGRLVRTMLYGLSGSDPISLIAAVVVLAIAGLAAGYLPARRASRVDPVVALRYE
ncbi:MAG TPA: ABC transporter permease [Candidatus Sulfotelmatobacter sp.]|nr:ABC transporter permease [Candidatus Sulfotelmatobacter sp.]